jgi:hypothetical protein
MYVVNGMFFWHVCASAIYSGDAHGNSASSNVPCLCSEIANYQACGYLMSDALRGTISISCRSSSFWHSHGKLLISTARVAGTRSNESGVRQTTSLRREQPP